MDSWRNQILNYFTPQVSKLTIVFDPDGILQEEVLISLIKQRGFEIIEYEDSISFRYAYESSYRSLWDTGYETDLIVVLRTKSDNEYGLPYDLLKAGRKIFLHLSDIFHFLSLPVVRTLHPSFYDKLYTAHNQFLQSTISENETRDFILLHIFDIAPQLVKNDADILKTLLDYHRLAIKIPGNICDRLINILLQKDAFSSWPIAKFFYDKNSFMKFLQKRWGEYIQAYMNSDQTRVDEPGESGYDREKVPGGLPFSHPDIQSRVSLLFIENTLQPLECNKTIPAYDSWMLSGISNYLRKPSLSPLFDELEKDVSVAEFSAIKWNRIAVTFSKISQQIRNSSNLYDKVDIQRYEKIQSKVDEKFYSWLVRKYSSLYNMPADPPVMLHQIPKYLYKNLEADQRVALFVIDGMALNQWMIIKDVLQKQDQKLCFADDACFAWIPTITSISRQAVFAGKMPMYFEDSIYHTSKEEKLWTNFWVDKGVNKNQVRYMKGKEAEILTEVTAINSGSENRILGVVIDKVDKIIHGMELGAKGMLNQVNLWAESGFLWRIIDHLLENRYNVYITSDHGNVESSGIGAPKAGSLAESSGQRMRIYSSKELRTAASQAIKDSIEWEPSGLPGNMYPLLAAGRTAFTSDGEIIMTHGGANIEEVIVPFITVSRYGDE